MVLVREAVPDDWRTLRGIRLTALADAPDAFAATYAQEAVLAEADWRGRIAAGGSFLAYLPELGPVEPAEPVEPSGLAGGYELAPGDIHLVAMWVRPQARGHGVGAALITAVTGWAKARDATEIHLWVNENNIPARRLYQRCGFVLTGERAPLPSNPALHEVAMTRPL
jgi:ribosomal protein S18 acetylase RimI-like enzyme